MAIDSLLDVFIYTDSEDRLVATTLKPYLYLNEFAYLKLLIVQNLVILLILVYQKICWFQK